jgi:hypothetical protein
MSAALKILCIVLALTVSCVLIGVAPYPAAAVMAATGVAAVGANRAITGACWGACIGKTICEHDSGLCVPTPCGGECRFDEICQHDRCILRQREQPGAAIDDDGGSARNDAETPAVF